MEGMYLPNLYQCNLFVKIHRISLSSSIFLSINYTASESQICEDGSGLSSIDEESVRNIALLSNNNIRSLNIHGLSTAIAEWRILLAMPIIRSSLERLIIHDTFIQLLDSSFHTNISTIIKFENT